MKTRLLFFLIIVLSFTANAQFTITSKDKVIQSLLMDDDEVTAPAFDPLTYDANTVVLYDGDLELTTSAWEDQTVNGFDLTLYNTPTVVSNAINGHQAVRFDGINQYGRRTTTPTRNQPVTIYAVVKQITWTDNDRIHSSETNDQVFYQAGGTIDLRLYAGAMLNAGGIATDTYAITTIIFDGTTSEIRINLDDATIGNAGTGNPTGITLVSNSGGSDFGNVEFAYYMLRQGHDDTATQDLFIAFLKTRFGL
jgi:hypothetical protein